MRTVQEIFNLVIESGSYCKTAKYDDNGTITHSYYMCHALAAALDANEITVEEYVLASGEIKKYLMGWTTLTTALLFNDLPNEYEDRLAIYKDWANKPELTTPYTYKSFED